MIPIGRPLGLYWTYTGLLAAFDQASYQTSQGIPLDFGLLLLGFYQNSRRILLDFDWASLGPLLGVYWTPTGLLLSLDYSSNTCLLVLC